MLRGSSWSSAERISLKRRIVMKTIEERAKEYASKKADISFSAIYNEALANVYMEGYIAGAKEQNRIDIDKACDWLKARNVFTDASLDGFRKAMEEE